MKIQQKFPFKAELMKRNDRVSTVREVRDILRNWLENAMPDIKNYISFGLPEVDDRYNLWRTPITIKNGDDTLIGEVKLNMKGEVVEFTQIDILLNRVKKLVSATPIPQRKCSNNSIFIPTPVPNKVILGDADAVLEELPVDAAQLVITSPPYYNTKPEYSEYVDYQEYLDFLRRVIVRIHTILSEGRFFIINTSPVLIRRTSRTSSSRRIPIPFDVHRIMESAGFEFIDDIIWVKPEGAGWNTGRGRRFAADRQPLQYKPVPVTEYVLVYRKKTDKLIDWNIRKHYDKELVEKSKILGEYDVTNVWYIPPGHSRDHPAVFPDELIRKLIRYYSFIDDLVLDPFAGSGTVGRAALEMDRRFLLIDNNPVYYKVMKKELSKIIPNVRVDFEVSEKSKEDNVER